MKKVLLSAVAILGFTFANAQEEEAATGFGFAQGDIIVEGNLSFGTSTDEVDTYEEKNSNFNFNPKAGYFISDKFAVGIELGVGSSKYEETDTGYSYEETANSFNGGVFARYYFLELGKRFKTYAEAGVGFGSEKWENDGEEVRKDTGFGVGVDLGINYFVTERFAINFGLTDLLSFNSTKSEYPGTDVEPTNNSFNGNFNVFNNFFQTAQFGLTWKF